MRAKNLRSPRRPTFPDSPRTGAKQRTSARNNIRMPLSQLLARVKDKDPETAGWARDGWLNTAVLNSGDHEHLRALAAMGATFPSLRWSNPERMQHWNQAQAREWLDILFDRGWDGHTGSRQVILEVAEYHPHLLSLWSTRVPKTWQTRWRWLEGMLTLSPGMTPARVQAELGVGATPGSAAAMGMERWIVQSKPGNGDEAVLHAIHAFMQEDKKRRRVRGEPPFRDWPWEQTLELAIKSGSAHLIEAIVGIKGPMTMEQTMQLVCQSADPLAMLDRVRDKGWKLPTASSKQSGAFVSMAIVEQGKINGWGKPASAREALALRLLEEGYGGTLNASAKAYVDSDRASEALRKHIQHRQLDRATSLPGIAPCRPRPRL